jgi:hypothetical protein
MLAGVVTVAAWKGQQEYREYRVIADAADALAAACETAGSPCLTHVRYDR